MGYRSDVTMIMYPSTDHRDKFALLKLYVDENFPDEFEVRETDTARQYLYCYIEGVKWYDSYEEVQKYTKAFNEWDEMFADPDDPSAKKGWQADTIFQYEFMRIGEDYEDVEYHQSYGADHALNMSREVYIDL